MAIRIEQVDAGSEAEALGLAPGDELLSVDDNELNDTLELSGAKLKDGHAAPLAAGSRPIWAMQSIPAPTTACSASSTSCPRACARACISRMMTSG